MWTSCGYLSLAAIAEASLFALADAATSPVDESGAQGFTGVQIVRYGEPPDEVSIPYFCEVP